MKSTKMAPSTRSVRREDRIRGPLRQNWQSAVAAAMRYQGDATTPRGCLDPSVRGSLAPRTGPEFAA